ncbi:choice-of-anchor A family protein [Dyadobacter sp. CY323]|nr:choice-of-anchor A family protein [Dyadobacter sp. CY323]
MGFNIFTKGNLTVAPNEIEGPVAVGGDMFVTGNYQITFNRSHGVFFVDGVSIGLAVRGGLKLGGALKVDGKNYAKIGNGTPDSGDLTKLKVWYKDYNNAESTIRITDATITQNNGGYDSNPNFIINANVNEFKSGYKVGVSNNPVIENVFGSGAGQIDVDGAFPKLIKASTQLKELADNLPILKENDQPMPGAAMGPYLTTGIFDQNPTIKVDPAKINVLTVSAEVWNSINNINFKSIPSGQAAGTTDAAYAAANGKFGLIINIVDFPTFCAKQGNSELKFPNMGGFDDSKGSYVVFNFPDATKDLTLKGAVIYGSILAPQANVFKRNNGNLNGQVIAKTFDHKGDEIHFWPFIPTVTPPVEKTITVVASSKCLNNAPYLDYVVTPHDFDATGKTVKIEWINSEDKVVKEDAGLDLTGSILFPGAALDINGKGMAWPGYEKKDGKWVEIEDDRFGSLRIAGAKIKVTVDPWTTISIEYPESATNGSCYTSPPPGSTLPVTLASFTAKNENCNVALKWVVSEAKDFSHFVVERSSDARTFSPLARIDYSAGKSAYSFADAPFSSESTPSKYYYYRLQQVDTDESFEYSAIRSVDGKTCDTRLAVDFYPNPTQDEVNVKSFSPLKKVEIYTLGGKKVYQQLPAQNETEIRVNVQAFAQGLYIVNVVNGEGKYSSKILKK